MPWAAAGSDFSLARRCEFRGVGIDFIDINAVGAEIGCQSVLASWIDIDGVSVGLLLAALIGAGALMLDKGGNGPELAICIDGERGDATAAIVGNQDQFARGMNVHMTRSASSSGLLRDGD